jgi:hypothetical protein
MVKRRGSGGDTMAVTLEDQVRRYQDLVKRAADLRSYL